MASGYQTLCPFPLATEAVETSEAFIAELVFRKPIASELDAIAILRTEMQTTLQRETSDLDWTRIIVQGAPVGRDYGYRITIPKLVSEVRSPRADDTRAARVAAGGAPSTNLTPPVEKVLP